MEHYYSLRQIFFIGTDKEHISEYAWTVCKGHHEFNDIEQAHEKGVYCQDNMTDKGRFHLVAKINCSSL